MSHASFGNCVFCYRYLFWKSRGRQILVGIRFLWKSTAVSFSTFSEERNVGQKFPFGGAREKSGGKNVTSGGRATAKVFPFFFFRIINLVGTYKWGIAAYHFDERRERRWKASRTDRHKSGRTRTQDEGEAEFVTFHTAALIFRCAVFLQHARFFPRRIHTCFTLNRTYRTSGSKERNRWGEKGKTLELYF